MSGIHRLVAADNRGMVEPSNAMLADESLENPTSTEETSEESMYEQK